LFVFCSSLKYLRNSWTDLHKFTGETCLVPCLDVFECQGQRSKIKVTGTKDAPCTPITPGSIRMVCACCKQRHAAADGTIPSLPGVTLEACIWFMFGKTSLALVVTTWIVVARYTEVIPCGASVFQEKQGSAVADEPNWRAASRQTCCKRRWTLSVINMQPK